jgi:hypothetical protein
MEIKIVTLQKWKEKAEGLFGKDMTQWKFKCPQCGGVQTLQDFTDNSVENAIEKFYFSCIGRWVKNRGCNWTLGGLFQVHKTIVTSADGKNIAVFEFDE